MEKGPEVRSHLRNSHQTSTLTLPAFPVPSLGYVSIPGWGERRRRKRMRMGRRVVMMEEEEMVVEEVAMCPRWSTLA